MCRVLEKKLLLPALLVQSQEIAQESDKDLLMLSKRHQSNSGILFVSLGVATKVIVGDVLG